MKLVGILYRYYIMFRCYNHSYMKTVLFYVYYIFGWFTIILNLFSNFNKKKIVTKKMLTIIIPTLINCGIMKCLVLEYGRDVV